MAFAQGGETLGTLSATTAGAASTFGVQAKTLFVKNLGANTVYVSISSTAGSTAGYPLASGAEVKIDNSQGYLSGVSVITSTSTGAGPTATVSVWAIA